jgi:hypothetical protein
MTRAELLVDVFGGDPTHRSRTLVVWRMRSHQPDRKSIGSRSIQSLA